MTGGFSVLLQHLGSDAEALEREAAELWREEHHQALTEARKFGVNSPGFNQTLGAIDELQMLLDAVAETGQRVGDTGRE